MATDCGICLEIVSSSVAIVCPRCQIVLHPTCVQTFLLNTIHEPNCPKCSHQWSHEFLADHLPKTWRLRVYRKYRESIITDRERSLIPATQEAAAAELDSRIRKRESDDRKARLSRIRDDLRRVRKEFLTQNAEFKLSRPYNAVSMIPIRYQQPQFPEGYDDRRLYN